MLHVSLMKVMNIIIVFEIQKKEIIIIIMMMVYY